MKVLVAGLTKTGTKTMATALRVLGYEVYDFLENFYYLGEDWKRQVIHGFNMEDMRRMYENVDAAVDTPCDAYWEEIFDAFPDVKVILTTREEKKWVKSFKNQMDQLSNDLMFRLACTLTYTGAKGQNYGAICTNPLVRYQSWPFSGRTYLHDKALIRAKRRHERNVKQVVPEKQLLVYEVTQGWEPLCEFLGVAVPKVPFPHKNKGGDLANEWRRENPVMQRIERELRISLFCLCLLFSYCLYAVFHWTS